MDKLHNLNNYILEEYKHLPCREELAIPLLISSNPLYVDNLKRKILYIGQETNCWMNYNDPVNVPDIDEIEDQYYRFLKEGARNKDYWKFIKSVLNIEGKDLINNVIWNNMFIAGKRTEIGHPNNDKLEKLSVEYLLEVTKMFNPEYTILTTGPTNPYYHMTYQYLKALKSNLINSYPTRENPMIYDENIIWTYHPNYQNRIHQKQKVIEKVSKIINN